MTARTLLDDLKQLSARACDVIRRAAEVAGADAIVSVVISHPGTVEDAFVVGQHDPAELAAILVRLETGPRAESDVTSTHSGPTTIVTPGSLQ